MEDMSGSDRDAVSVNVGELEFSDGTKIQLGESDIVVFVGPNNAGKRPFRNPAKTSLHGSPGTPKPAEIGYHVIAERPSEGPLNPPQ
ncbi:hypothetical protein VQ044_09700 [Aurantimonas sp. C2-5-R2]